jgi:hypothetical protein
MYEENLSVMGVASCRSTFLCLMLRVRLVPSRFSVHDWSLFDGRACRGFRPAKWLGPNPTQPSSARPCAPLAPTPPHAPPPLLSLSFGFPAQQPPSPSSTSLSPWCPRDWRRRSSEFGPRGELPSPLLSLSPLSLSLSLLSPLRALPLLSPAHASLHGGAPCSPLAALGRPLPFPLRRRGAPPLPFPGAGARPLRERGSARPRHGSAPGAAPPRRFDPCARPSAPARGVLAPDATRVAPFTP